MASEAAARLLLSNPPDALAECCRVLNALLANLARDDCDKHRRVNLRNARIQSSLLSARFALEFLLACGFERAGEEALELRRPDASALAAAAQAALDAACVLHAAPLSLRGRLPAGGARAACAVHAATVATGGGDNAVRVWSTAPPVGEAAVCELHAHEGVRGVNGVCALLRTPRGEVASCGRDGKVVVWEVAEAGGKVVRALHGHGDERGQDVSNKHTVACLAHDGGARLFSGGWDWSVRVWGEGEEEAVTLRAHEAAVLALAVLADGRLASGSGDGTVRLWAAEGGAYACAAVCQAGCVVRGLAATADGGFAQVGNDGVLRLWSSAGVVAHQSSSVGSYLFCVAADNTCAQVFTGGDDGVLRVWSTSSGLQCVQSIATPAETWSIALLDRGGLLLASDDAGALLFTREPSKMAPAAQQKELAALASARSAATTAQPPPPAAGGGGGGGGGGEVNGTRYDHVYPVEMGGGSTQIYWNNGDDLQAVAAQFALRNQVPLNELDTIMEFIRTASGGQGGGAPPPPAASPPPQVQAERLQQVMEMGFDVGRARAALERAGWSVEGALSLLLQ